MFPNRGHDIRRPVEYYRIPAGWAEWPQENFGPPVLGKRPFSANTIIVGAENRL